MTSYSDFQAKPHSNSPYLTNMTKKSSTKSKPSNGAKSTPARTLSTRSPRKWFYERNSKFLVNPVNKYFEDVLWMSQSEFRHWVRELRKVVTWLWDKDGMPPVCGQAEKDIVDDFAQIESFQVYSFLKDHAGKHNQRIIVNDTNVGSAVNQWFPTMMKTTINHSANLEAGRSIYDYFKKRELFESFVKYATRHFKKDSFRKYSHRIPKQDSDTAKYLFRCDTGVEWIKKFEAKANKLRLTHDYWLSAVKDDAQNSDCDDAPQNTTFLTVSRTDLKTLPTPEKCKVNITDDSEKRQYLIRVFEKKQRLFPDGFAAFRTSMAQFASNFPPLTAKFIYERYLTKLDVKGKAYIWDPSAGWGGRILGAMGIRREFNVHYIGTDPNTDHTTGNGRTKYHEIADFYNAVRTGKKRGHGKRRRFPKTVNSYEIYQCGSENMRKQPQFQQYRGRLDIVFSSPPYFAKEVYSEDANQSSVKHGIFEEWRDFYLKPTLETAVEWLRPGGYLIWNIANIKLGKKRFGLEDASCKILKELGMKRIEVLHMALSNMPGANRQDSIKAKQRQKRSAGSNKISSKLSTAHGCVFESNGKLLDRKYEPIFVYQKPITAIQKSSGTVRKLAREIDPQDSVNKVSKLATEFHNAITAPKINPRQLRIIYAELEALCQGRDITEFFRYFNRCRKRNDYFVTEALLNGKKLALPLFAQRKVTNHSTKKLAGQNVLVQFLERNRDGKIVRLFAHGEVEPPDFGDDPKTAWVRISDKPSHAEEYLGTCEPLSKFNVLTIGTQPARFSYK
jgi:hypothetical protein